MNARTVCLVATVLWLGGEAPAAGADWMGQRLPPPALAPGDRFGATVAIGKDIIVVGAYSSDAGGTDSGALYFYERRGTSWARLDDRVLGQAGDQLGFDLAVDAANGTLLAGAPLARVGAVRCGVVRRFTLSATGVRVREEPSIEPPPGECEAGAEFGSAVAVKGGVLAVGARGAGRRQGRVYARFPNEVFHRLAADVAEGDELGTSLATDGTSLAAGAPFADAPGTPDSGAVYVFASGQPTRRVLPQSRQARATFGYSVALDNDLLAVGAPLEDDPRLDAGAVHRFSKGDWTEVLRTVAGAGAGDQLGVSVASGKSGLFAGARRAGGRGAVYPIAGSARGAAIVSPNPEAGAEFGFAVATQGNVLAVGAFLQAQGTGAAYVFEQPQEVKVELEVATCVFESERVPVSVTITTDDELPTRVPVTVRLQTCPVEADCTARAGSDFDALDVTAPIAEETPSGSSLPLAELGIRSNPGTQDPRVVVVGVSVNGEEADEERITIHDSPLVLTAAPLSTSESGGTASLTVRLACRPAKPVRVSLSSGDSSEASVPPTALRFTAASWNQPQSWRVTGVDDALCDGPQPYGLQVSTTSADSRFAGLLRTVPGTNADDELACLSAANSVCAYADNTVVYTIDLSNAGPATVTSHLEDPLPATLSVVTASADEGVATVDYLENSVVWNGPAPLPGGLVTITVVAALDPVPAGTDVANQATLTWPRDSRGSMTTAASDDPATPQPADATVFDAFAVGCPP